MKQILSLVLALVLTLQTAPIPVAASAPGVPSPDPDSLAVSDTMPETTVPLTVPAVPKPVLQVPNPQPYQSEPEPELPEPPEASEEPTQPAHQTLPMEPELTPWEQEQPAVVQSENTAQDFAWTVKNGVLTISGHGDMPNHWSYVEGDEAPWHSRRSEITKLVVEEGITSIGFWAFYDCEAMTEVVLPESLRTIFGDAFYSCTSLKSIKIPDGVTRIDGYAFWHCESLTSIELPQTLTQLASSMFAGCESLTTIQLPPNLTEINSYLFSGCKSLTEIEIPAGVTQIYKCAFSGCSSLNSIRIPDGVTVLEDSTFAGCSSLTEIIFPSGLTTIGQWVFEDCEALTSIRIPEGVTSIGSGAFYSCDTLESVELPESLTSIDSGTFHYCYALTDVVLPENMTVIPGSMFNNCTSLEQINIPAGVTEIKNYAFANCVALRSVELPEGLTKLGINAFEKCAALESIHIPEGVTSIGEDTFAGCTALSTVSIDGAVELIDEKAFHNCTSLTSLSLADGAPDIGKSAFENCTALTSVEFSGGLGTLDKYAFRGCTSLPVFKVPSGPVSIGPNAFENCTSLTEVAFSEGLITIENDAFRGCQALTKVTLPVGLQTIGNYAFFECNALTEVTLPAGLQSIGDHAFHSCVALSEINFPAGLTWVGNNAFEGCRSLEKVEFKEGLTGVGEQAFYCCTALTSLKLPESMTTIGDYAFTYCSVLEEIVFSEGLTTIGNYAFYGCDALTEIQLPAGVTTLGESVFSHCIGLTKVVLREGLTSIGPYLFMDCTALTSVTLPEDFPRISPQMFHNCSSLTTIEIPAGVTSIDYAAFYQCPALSRVEMHPGLTTIGEYAFQECPALTELVFPESLTTIGVQAFCSCESLTSVQFPESLTTLDENAFYGCTALTSVELPGSLENCGPGVFGYCTALTTAVINGSSLDVGNNAFESCTALESVVISEGVKGIGNQAFQTCSTLVSLSLPEGLERIGKNAFRDCKYLTALTLPESLTSLGEGAFRGCFRIQSAVLPQSLTKIDDYTFYGCSALEQVTLSSELTSIGEHAFDRCELLALTELPEGLTSIGSFAFYNCSALALTQLPEGLTTIDDNTFSGCNALALTELPEGLTSIGRSAFSGCDALALTELPAGLTSIGSVAFSSCSALALTELPAGLTAIDFNTFSDCSALALTSLPEGLISIGSSAFKNCSALALTQLPEGLTSIGASAFENCSALALMQLPEGLTSIGERAFYLCRSLALTELPAALTSIENYTFYGCTALALEAIPDGVTKIGSNAFYSCKSLAVTSIPSSVTKINSSAFRHCSGLTRMEIQANITGIESSTFAYCSSLTTVVLPETLRTIGESAFSSCSALTTIDLPEKIHTIGEGAFSGCSALTAIDLPEALQIIGDSAFYGCTAMHLAQLPETLTSLGASAFRNCESISLSKLPAGLKSIRNYAFQNCKGITVSEIPAGVTYIDNYAFSGCTSIPEMVIPESVTNINSYAFQNCTALTDVQLSVGLNTIRNAAFSGCTALRELRLPSSLTELGSDAFSGCSSMETLKLSPSLTSLNTDCFDGCASLTEVVIPEGVTGVNSGAFANCQVLSKVVVPLSVENISGYAFSGSKNVNIHGYAGSYAEDYASRYSIPFVSLGTYVAPNIAILVRDEAGNTITTGYHVEWYQEGLLIGTGNVLQITDTNFDYACRVVLEDALLVTYFQPQEIPFHTDADLTLECVLRPIPRIQLSGRLLDEAGTPIPGTVQLIQQFPGGPSQTQVLSAGADGCFSGEAAAVTTTLRFQAEGFREQSLPLTLTGFTEAYAVGDVNLTKLPDAKVHLELVRMDAVRYGEANTQTELTDFDGWSFTVENVTRNTAITDFTVQYPYLIPAVGSAEAGDTLRIRAAHTDGLVCEPVQVQLNALASGHGVLTCRQQGSFLLETITGRVQSRMLVFDADGMLVYTDLTYQGYRSRDLKAGRYQVVLMQPTELLGSVSALTVLEEYGLVSGTDYAMLNVTIRNGVVTVVDEVQIPRLNESRLYYTDADKTSVTLNSATAFAGKYVLLRLEYKLREEFTTSAETVSIEIPAGIQAADSSLTVDNEKVPFTIENNTIRLSVNKPQAVIRLYLFSEQTGDFSIDTRLAFSKDGDTVVQPLGTVKLEVSAATFLTPERTSYNEVPVSGMTVPRSTVTVYDGNKAVGTTVANANGSWNTIVTLENPYSYICHSISIGVKHENLDQEVRTEGRLLIYDAAMIEPVRVTMRNGHSTAVFDFRGGKTQPYYVYDNSYFTFVVELTRNHDPAIEKVYVVTANTSGRTTYIECAYDSTKDRWVGSYRYAGSQDVPVGLDVRIVMKTPEEDLLDEEDMKELEDALQDFLDEYDKKLEEEREEIRSNLVLPDFGKMKIDDVIQYTNEVQADADKVYKETQETIAKNLEAQGVKVEQTKNGTKVTKGTKSITYREEILDKVDQAELKRNGFTANKVPGKEPVYTRTQGNVIETVDPNSKSRLICEMDSYIDNDVDLTDPSSLLAYKGMAEDIKDIIYAERGYITDAGIDLSKIPNNYYEKQWRRLTTYNIRTQIAMQDLDEKIFDLKQSNADPKLIKKYEDQYERLKELERIQFDELSDMGKHARNIEAIKSVDLFDMAGVALSAYSLGESINKGATLRFVHDALAGTCKNNADYERLSREISVTRTSMNVAAGAGLTIDIVNVFATSIAPPVGLVLGVASFTAQKIAESSLNSEYNRIATELKTLDCDGDGIPDYLDGDLAMQTKYVIVDPSGYVYEAVPSNRLEGVKAEVYYQGYTLDEYGVPKEEPEDILWDAEDYDQVNPQYTDAEGRYHWDVPFGLWLVKYSKDGYLDTDSRDDPAANEDGYLPVPPPQLEVNVGMVSTAAPLVESLNVYQDQIQVIFSQYMKPAQIDLEVISGGSTVSGRLESANAEYNEEQTEQFATIFNFIPDRELSGTATVSISRAVNYAGTEMAAAFTQTKPVCIRPSSIVMEKTANLILGETAELKLQVLPVAAGAGRTLTVTSAFPGLVDVAEQTVTTDADGCAVITLIGTLPSTATVTARLDGTDLEASTEVVVDLERVIQCEKVTASIPSGSVLDHGTQLELRTATEGAEIYYTLDGTCPCVEDSPSRIHYTGPITLTEDTFLIAYAVKEGFDDSFTAGFMYTVKPPCTHSNTITSGAVEAGCTSEGFTGDKFCADCGAELEKGTVIPALGHEYIGVMTAPGCTTQGYTTYTCRCGDRYVTDYTEPRGHAWMEGDVIKEPTADSEGEQIYICILCGETKIVKLPMQGHEHSYDTVVTAPTCTEQGYTTYTCHCGHSYAADYVLALGHDMGQWYVITQATCDAYGLERRNCSRCDHSEEQKIPASGHRYEVSVIDPTCTEQGYSVYCCIYCEDTYMDDYVPMVDHTWDDGVVSLEPTVDHEGEMLYTCTVCAATRTEAIPKIHVHTNMVLRKVDPTCLDRGYTIFLCTDCGEVTFGDYLNALGHSFGQWTEVGGGMEERACERCGHTEQQPVGGPVNPFTDVPEGSFYYEPVLWAVRNGITAGTTPTTFGPNDKCMRAHVVTFLWRAAGSPEPTRTENPFVDVKPTDFYYKPVLWAVENGITAGLDATHFGPTSYCNRAQVVTFLHRAKGSPAPASMELPFTDVASGAWYAAPVAWAVETGVTAGLTATTFGPNAICNRAQIVTFLYRAYNK